MSPTLGATEWGYQDKCCHQPMLSTAWPGGAGQLVSTSCPLEFKSYEDFLAEDWDQIIEQKYLPGYFWKM